ncbi:MAG TPA: MarR family transcriptional regulator, partial [Ruegeria sp.]|nr:MarR family transcriptional regulator [Ruegeria sp.]
KAAAEMQNAQALAGLEEAERTAFTGLMRRVIANMQRG